MVSDLRVLLGLLEVRQEPDVLGVLQVKVQPRVKARLVHVIVGVDL